MTEGGSLATRERLIHIHQGECRISEDIDVVLTTMLGSCIAACMYDPETNVGGMNHFLLPEAEETDPSASLRYGANAMELLVNGLLTIGAKRSRLVAKLFGGSRFVHGMTNIGEKNSEFAERYLKREGIRLVGGSVGGRQARRIQFWPVSGRARQLALDMPVEEIAKMPRLADKGHGVVELF